MRFQHHKKDDSYILSDKGIVLFSTYEVFYL
nr:MAG TPA: hypothetical protein [Caudoviricetes sp.]